MTIKMNYILYYSFYCDTLLISIYATVSCVLYFGQSRVRIDALDAM